MSDDFPNLDAMSMDDLEDTKQALRTLAEYINLKQLAHCCRVGGMIAKAIRYEREMDELYDSLPVWAKW